MNGFKDCKIIFKSVSDKKEFLRMCRYLHDFSVFFLKRKKSCKCIHIMEDSKKGIKPLKDDRDRVNGISLDFDKYPFLNFLVGLHEMNHYDDKKIRSKYLNKHLIVR